MTRFKRALKWLGIGLGALALVLAVALAVLSAMASRRITARYEDIHPDPIEIPTDAESIAEGGRLYRRWMCVECHLPDGTGKVEDAPPGRMSIANLTIVANAYSSEDWVRAVRHGVSPTGRPYLIMPATEYQHMSDAELGRIVAFVRSLPRGGATRPPPELNLLGRTFMALDITPVPFLAAERIDHEAARPATVARGPTAEYGHYLAAFCVHCHGESLTGGERPMFPFIPANLTRHETGLAAWSESDFVHVMRTGSRPDGRALDQLAMPTRVTSSFDDVELAALWAYMQSVPPRPFGEP